MQITKCVGKEGTEGKSQAETETEPDFDVSKNKTALAQYLIACLVLYLTALNYMR